MTLPPLLDVKDLSVEFRQGRRTPPLRAVDKVSLSIAPGETLGLVGESGSGKSTIGRAVLGLNRVDSGQVHFEGRDITHASRRTRRELSARLQVVFQDPYSSLNPARTIGQTLAETLLAHGDFRAKETAERVKAMLERVGMPADTADRYPGQFSGGQRQRIAIARALMPEPRLVICDEPVSALDLSIQAQVMNLLAELQRDLDLSYLFIAHDLPVVRHLSHRIVVLYRGRVMETGPAGMLYADPVHPYTRALLAAVPRPDPRAQRARTANRTAATTATAPATDGCVFAHRCLHAVLLCHSEPPPLLPLPDGRAAACHRTTDINSLSTPGSPSRTRKETP
ncbi:ABC transporter ATP-binding protein [Streptomyces sp. ISL-22]|uniref:ABC transporter ATP-binding protein n=1 Tax=unclassified Streptomyces TaxID=2593676 RepID=UPI001BEB5F0A|nr:MULTISPECIES: oligopeptide/dipeptide ABC transporter ATP-binding protein [unclassified Streptomyces]MBT2422458.1 ABC transporter ATP-binding protein [Streptomyces sp. ISL-24]MBT2436509.1 ABC transporter ATP-binding protein [Streptomyces sp. ISL-22]